MITFVAIPFVVWPLQCVKLTSAAIGVKLNALLGNYDEPTDHQMDRCVSWLAGQLVSQEVSLLVPVVIHNF